MVVIPAVGVIMCSGFSVVGVATGCSGFVTLGVGTVLLLWVGARGVTVFGAVVGAGVVVPVVSGSGA